MEERSLPVETHPHSDVAPVADNINRRFSKIPKSALILGLVIVVGVLILGVWWFSQSQKRILSVSSPWNNSKSYFKPDQKLASVGKFSISGSDANYIVYSRYNNSLIPVSSDQSEDSIKKDIVNFLVDESAILQYGRQKGIIHFDDKVLSDPNQVIERERLFNQLKGQLDPGLERLSASQIAIWYYNMASPSTTLAQAEGIAKAKITAYQRQIKNKEITIKQAGAMIATDSSLLKLDKNYVGNSYTSFTLKKLDEPLFSDDELNQVLLTLQPGQVSDVIQVKKEIQMPASSYTGGKARSIKNYYFAVVQLDGITGQGSYSEWLKQAKQAFGPSQ